MWQTWFFYTQTIWSTKFFPEKNPVQFFPFNFSKLIERLSFRDQMLSNLWNDFVLLTFPKQLLPESNIFYGGESTAFFATLVFQMTDDLCSKQIMHRQKFWAWNTSVSLVYGWKGLVSRSCSRLDINWSLFWGCLQGRRFWWGLWVWPGLNLITLQLPKEGR